MHLRIARTLPEIDGLEAQWQSLHSAAAEATLFQSFGWNRLAAQWFGDREAPCVIYAENGSGAALVPAAIAGEQVTFLGEAMFDYRDVLWTGEGEALAAALREVSNLGVRFSLPAVRGACRLPWRNFELIPFCDALCARRCESDAAGFVAAHRRSGRFIRRLQRAGVEFRHHHGDASALLRWLYWKKAEQFAGADNNLFADPRRREFIVAACAMQPALVDVFTLESVGAVVAALVALRDGDVRRCYTTWFDRKWAWHSPGTALLYEVTRQSLAAGLDCDYMTGTQLQKQRFATSAVPLFRVEVGRQELARAADELALAPARQAA